MAYIHKNSDVIIALAEEEFGVLMSALNFARGPHKDDPFVNELYFNLGGL